MKRYSYKKTAFDPGYEDYVRILTNPNGRGNAAYCIKSEREMLPQDKLLYADITMGLTTGVAVEFGWASGRKDTWAVLDKAIKDAPRKVRNERIALIAKLKKEHANAA